MPASTSSFDKKVQRFQRLVHEMAEKIVQEQSQTKSQDLDTEGLSFIYPLFEKQPELKELPIEKAAEVCALKKDALSLHALQYFHAQNTLNQIQSYLEQFPASRKKRIYKSLQFNLQQCMSGLRYRFPVPSDAPQPVWNQLLEKLRSLQFEKQWKELGHLLYSDGPSQIITKKESSWKIRVIQKLALSQALGKHHSGLEVLIKTCPMSHLTIWNRDPLTSDQVTALMILIQPQKSLEIQELNEADSAIYNQLCQQLLYLKELNISSCKKINFKSFLQTFAPKLKRLTLQGALFEKDDLKHLQMPLLTYLDLSESNVTSEMIAEITSLPHLRELRLSRCFNINTLSVELLKHKFPELRKLILDRCGSLFNPALRQLPLKISHLSLNWSNGITTEGFEKLNFLKKSLRSFHVSHCRGFDEGALEALCEHEHLKSLHLDHCLNLLPEVLDAYLPQFTQLRELSLRGLTLYPETWKWIESQPLRLLRMPKWTGIPNDFQLPQLEHLDFGKADLLTEEGFKYLLSQPSLDGLKSFWIENAMGMTDEILPVITRWKQLSHLRIWSDIDSIQLFTPEGIKQLSVLENLEHLELSHCGTFDLESLEELLRSFTKLKSFEFGPLFKIDVEDVKKLRLRLPWIRITCYYYPEIPAL